MAYSYARSLTVDHTQCGASDSLNFASLVKLSDVTLKTVANGGHVQNANGYDIAFYADFGLTTPLFWEIDFYDGVNGILWAWVKIPTISHSTDTVFYVIYGDGTISTFQSTSTSVYDANFKGVLHFSNGTILSVLDSTIGANNGTAVNSPTATTGKIDGGMNLAGASQQHVTIGNTPNAPTAITYSLWVNFTSLPNAYQTVINKNGNIAGDYADLHIKSTGKLAPFVGAFNGTNNNVSYDGTGTYTLSTGIWYHLAITYDSVNGLKGYVNGALDGSVAAAGSLKANVGTTCIGTDLINAGRDVNGLIDEVRISDIARSADWILTEYNNQNSPSTFITMGAEQNLLRSIQGIQTIRGITSITF